MTLLADYKIKHKRYKMFSQITENKRNSTKKTQIFLKLDYKYKY